VNFKVIQGQFSCHLKTNNLGSITYRFMATYSLKLITENCGQTAAGGDMVTIDSQ